MRDATWSGNDDVEEPKLLFLLIIQNLSASFPVDAPTSLVE